MLGTVFANGITDKLTELAATASGAPTPQQLEAGGRIAQAFGTTQTFGVAVWMMVAATVITLIGLSIRHEDLSSDGIPGMPAE